VLPDPLHPALVHFPIVLVVLLPLAAGAALWAIRRGVQATRAWLVPVGFGLALSLSSWVAVETGEREEEKVEEVVAESTIDAHADAAERFLALSVALTALLSVGLVANRWGAAARIASVVAAVGLIGAGYQVGHSGGALVYHHGAASAYLDGNPARVGDQDGEGRRTEGGRGRSERDDDP